MNRLGILTGILALLSAPTAWGALLAYEGFDYPNDDTALDGQSGGSGWLGDWASTSSPFSHSADDMSLDSAAFPFDPIGDRVVSQRTDQGGGTGIAARQWSGITMGEDDDVLYYSFLATKISEIADSTSGANVEVDIGTIGTPTAMRVGYTSNNALFVTGANAPGTVATADDFLQEGVTYFIVAKIASKAAVGEDTIQAVAYGPGDSVPLTEPTDWDVENTMHLNAFNDRARLWIGPNAEGAIDELRLGETWADVTRIPEPSSVLLLAMGILGWFACRRS